MGIDVVFAKDNATVNHDGAQYMIRKGQHWAAGDPLVRAYPGLFADDARYGMNYTATPGGYDPATLEPLETAEAADRGDTGAEQATAAPGEVRNARRPKAA